MSEIDVKISLTLYKQQTLYCSIHRKFIWEFNKAKSKKKKKTKKEKKNIYKDVIESMCSK